MAFNAEYTNSSQKFNPYSIGASAFDAMQDPNNYNQSNSFQDIGKIGTTGAGNTLNQIGNAGIATGNPYAAVGGAAVKSIGNAVDTVKYLTRDTPDIRQSNYSNGAMYDLGDEARDIANINSKQAFGEGFKKNLLLGGPMALAAGFLSSRKAKKDKTESIQKLQVAQGKFNNAYVAEDSQINAMERYNAIQQKSSQGLYGIPKENQSSWYI